MTNHTSQNPKWKVDNSNNETMKKPQVEKEYLEMVEFGNDRFKDGYNKARKEILKFIENERDNGNILNGFKDKMDGFSAGICLSDLMKYLKSQEGVKE